MKMRILFVVATAMALMSLPATGYAQQEPAPIRAGSKIFINPMDGFETWLVAGFSKKKVPLKIVSDVEAADFEISGTIQVRDPSKWERLAAIGAHVVDKANDSFVSNQVDVAITVRNLRTGEIVYGYAWIGMRNGYAWYGSRRNRQQSAAEACAENIKERIKGN